MNEDVYSNIFHNYLDNFDYLNDSEHNECFKWEMVHHFRDSWDPKAEDFYEMLKESICRQTSVFLDNSTTCPALGIVKLAAHEEARDQVKALFAELFVDDGGDIPARQERIEAFVDRANVLLDQYEPGKWKYKQEFRTVLAYLTFHDPENNYFYKATEARQMAEMLDFGGDIGSGKSFSLKNYYLMCSHILERAKSCESLMKASHGLISSRNSSEDHLPMCDYDDDHLLVFDIIYAGKYGIYSDLYYPIHMRKSSDKKNANRMRIDELIKELQNQKQILEDCIRLKSELDGFSAVGLPVVHRMLGAGTIIDQDESRILVKLEDAEKWFKLPDAFSQGFLDTEDADAKELMLRIDILNKEITATKSRITMYQNELSSLET